MYNKYLKYKIKYNKLNDEFSSKYLTELKNKYSSCKHDSGINSNLYEGHATTYGEMTYDGMNKLNSIINKNNDFKYFMDIGSGRGKLPLYMSGIPGIKKSYGIELVKDRFDDSIILKNDLANKFNYYTDKVEFINDNIFNIPINNFIKEKGFIWMSNLCFNPDINDDIFRKLHIELPANSVICCSKKPSPEVEKLFRINDTMKDINVPMSWSENSNIYVYVK